MKKFFLGVFVGVLLMLSGTAFAGTTVKNMIGMTVDGQYPVKINGTVLDTPAIVLDGTSFLPVRKFAETIGYAAHFYPEVGEIELSPNTPIIHGMDPKAKAENDKILEITRQMNVIYEKMGSIQSKLSVIDGNIKHYQDLIDDPQRIAIELEARMEVNQTVESKIKTYTDEIAILQSKRAVLQTQLDALQTQVDQLDRNRH